jgi:hypothetical protein
VKELRKRLVTTENLDTTKSILNEIRTHFREDLDKRPGLREIV